MLFKGDIEGRLGLYENGGGVEFVDSGGGYNGSVLYASDVYEVPVSSSLPGPPPGYVASVPVVVPAPQPMYYPEVRGRYPNDAALVFAKSSLPVIPLPAPAVPVLSAPVVSAAPGPQGTFDFAGLALKAALGYGAYRLAREFF